MPTKRGPQNEPADIGLRHLLKQLFLRIVDRFHLSGDTDRPGTIATIVESVEFKGTTVWQLIAAVFIASIGLNVNSAAVIIGAMLISPLMGPIMGSGLAIGIYDSALLRRSLVNLGIMTAAALITSFVYFSISPLSGAKSELVARTVPTFYDVLVALFGGLAMIIAISRKNRSSNTIAGVAVATALMPPLCTAGFGLATHNLPYFAGAMYLYLINSVFIGLTTFVFTKYLRLGKITNPEAKSIPKRQVALFVVLSVLFLAPSIFLAYSVVQETDFQAKADRFVAENFQFSDNRVINVAKDRSTDRPVIEVTMVGVPIEDAAIRQLQLILPKYGLPATNLHIIQSSGLVKVSAPGNISTPPVPAPGISADQDKDRQIAELQAALAKATSRETAMAAVSKEVSFLFPEIETFSYGDLMVAGAGPQAGTPVTDKEYTILVKWRQAVVEAVRAKFKVYVKLRLELPAVRVVDL